MKTKTKSLASIKKRLWHWFALFIRLRDSDENGYCRCISCGKTVIFGSGQLHAGHYYAKGNTFAALYFDEKNVNGQCNHCNTFLEGNAQGYAEGLIEKYGAEILTYLRIKKGNRTHWYQCYYEALIEEYKKKVKELQKGGGRRVYGISEKIKT